MDPIDQCQIFIVLNNPEPDFEDFMKAREDLRGAGIDEDGRVGVLLTKMQWFSLRRNLSLFELRMISPFGVSKAIMGFPVKIVEFFVEDKGI